MAHRKPLGTLCHTTADWTGDDPYLHDALVTDAGTWYRIVGIEETKSLAEALKNPDVAARRFKIKLTLERVAEPDLIQRKAAGPLAHWPDGDAGRVHEFTWYPRDRRRAAA